MTDQNDKQLPHGVRTTMEQTYSTARDTATKAYDRTIERASHAYGSTREGARDAARRTAEGIQTNPIVVLLGGLAVGALAGVFIPRYEREAELLGPIGRRLNGTAAAAAKAARKAGKDELDSLGLSRKAVRSEASRLFDGVLRAASSAGDAAATAAAKKTAKAK